MMYLPFGWKGIVWKQTSGGLALKFSSNLIYNRNIPPDMKCGILGV